MAGMSCTGPRAVTRAHRSTQVDAIVPTRKGQHSDLPVELEQLITQAGDYYYCPTVNLADLLQPVFLNSFLRQGEPSRLANHHRADCQTNRKLDSYQSERRGGRGCRLY